MLSLRILRRKKYALVAQLDRAQASDAWCRWFESNRVHHKTPVAKRNRGFVVHPIPTSNPLFCVLCKTRFVYLRKQILAGGSRLRDTAISDRRKLPSHGTHPNPPFAPFAKRGSSVCIGISCRMLRQRNAHCGKNLPQFTVFGVYAHNFTRSVERQNPAVAVLLILAVRTRPHIPFA